MDNDRKYQATLDYLYSFVDFSLTRQDRYKPDQFTLENMYKLMDAMDHPERKYAIIHIAGTKGKGSVAAYCSSALQAGGRKVGLYTSPHLHDYTERIKFNGIPIAHENLISLVAELKPIFESIPKITTFEITTALAFEYFRREQVDVAVVEVGLGGRLDATNVIDPVVSVITSISYDHTYLLGNTIAEIAGEKAGIIKPGVPVVLAPQEDEARQVIAKICDERSAPLIQVGLDYRYHNVSHSLVGQVFDIWSGSERPLDKSGEDRQVGKSGKSCQLQIPLLGEHQLENATTAYAALQLFQQLSFPVTDESIRDGFFQVQWPARFEVLQRFPPVVVDAAHNRDSAHKLIATLEDFFPNNGIILVFGASEDKDILGMLLELMPTVDMLIATQSYHPRSISPEKLVTIAAPFEKPTIITDDVSNGLEEALRVVGENQVVLVTGSIFVAAGGREAWLKRNGHKVYA
jgi:dihydrofolate synthase/folylpolyglutamate synthase